MRSFTSCDGTSSNTARSQDSFRQATRSPILNFTYALERLALTVLVPLSHTTSAWSASKIWRNGTRVRPC